MAEKHDGWIIKITWPNCIPFFLPWTFRLKRTDVVKAFEDTWDESWRNYRRNETHKIVKVKFVEVK